MYLACLERDERELLFEHEQEGYDGLVASACRDPDGGAQMGGASATYAYDGIGNLATSIWNTAATTYSANEHVWIMERNGARWLSGFMDTGETMCLV